MKKYIWVTFQKEGLHCYPEALKNDKLVDVSFLGHPHRHIFHFTVKVEVKGSNREIEFIQFKRYLESLYDCSLLQLDNKSCEMIAEDIINELLLKRSHYTKQLNLNYIEVTVSEDNENGATVLKEIVNV
jgi:hypothetical protein